MNLGAGAVHRRPRGDAHMAVVTITKDNFQQTIEQGGIVLIDWWAPWCGPCRAFAPVYERVAQANPDVTFAKVNTDEEQELAGAFNIRSIPTLMVFRDRVLLFSQPGALPQNVLEEIVKKARELDMEKVRAEVAKQQAEAQPGQAGEQASQPT